MNVNKYKKFYQKIGRDIKKCNIESEKAFYQWTEIITEISMKELLKKNEGA